ncbi:nitroreductase family protein [Pontibacter sp. SGAir0037]|uniref:nitroreductase family protein n=1 Tax=Pontibacter sp. SGAir0037 TaxID=2571030 RepID=UPI0010CCDC72|nr:nitroreductase family protein [Pontibacter sp. SGAir0037]QCR21072.1 nitroreductase [Pontibacter sp. SGAir0037]
MGSEVETTIHHLIKNRRSTRAYSDKPVPAEAIAALFEAARWAPSAMNEQPWRFIYAAKDKDPETYHKLLDSLFEGNSVWAKDAPVLILTVASKRYALNKSDNAHAWHDVGLATGNLLAQATELELYVHLMGGFSADKVREAFYIPDDFEPVTMIAVGYLGDIEQLPPHLKAREIAVRSRKPLSELVFTGNWGESSL